MSAESSFVRLMDQLRAGDQEAAPVALLWKYSYMLILPALAVSSLILGFNLTADGLREMSGRD